MTRAKTKEFPLSDEVPSAFSETAKKAAEKAWKKRSDAAAAAILIPTAPYRIIGDSDAGRWFVEQADVTRSQRPDDPDYLTYMHRYMLMGFGRGGSLPEPDYTAYIGLLADDQPTAKLEWCRIGKKRKGFFTYARARSWLLEYLQPVRDESTYFTPDGKDSQP